MTRYVRLDNESFICVGVRSLFPSPPTSDNDVNTLSMTKVVYFVSHPCFEQDARLSVGDVK